VRQLVAALLRLQVLKQKGKALTSQRTPKYGVRQLVAALLRLQVLKQKDKSADPDMSGRTPKVLDK